MERKGGIPRKRDNEIKVSNLSDIEFKIIGVRMLKELSENYRNFIEATRNLVGTTVAWKRDIETMNKNQEETSNTISEMNNVLEGIKKKARRSRGQNQPARRQGRKKYPGTATKQNTKTQKEQG